MEELEKSDLYRRVERIEDCLFGDPNDRDDNGMRADVRELVSLAHSGNIAIRVVLWMGGTVASIWAAWDWIAAHFPKAGA